MSENDNKLVSMNDKNVKKTSVQKVNSPNLWSDETRLIKMVNEMKLVTKTPYEISAKAMINYPEGVLMKALVEVLMEAGWSSYDKYNEIIGLILNGPRFSIPFSKKIVDKKTGDENFWIQKVFISVNDLYYEVDDVKFNKKEVLMSKSFSDYFRGYFKEQFNNEVKFWCFTGTCEGNQQLKLDYFNYFEKKLLNESGKTNADHLVMFQFKKVVSLKK